MTKFDTKTDALLDDLLKDCECPEDILGEHGLLKGLTKRLVERALQAELTEHLGYAPHARRQAKSGNTRNGTSPKRLRQTKALWSCKSHGIDRAHLNLRWSRNGNDGWRGLMTKS